MSMNDSGLNSDGILSHFNINVATLNLPFSLQFAVNQSEVLCSDQAE